VAERKDVLSTFFWLLTMLGYARYAERPGVARYLLVVGCFMLGLMTKPMLVTLPFVLLLLDYWPLRRVGIERFGEHQSGNLPCWRPLLGLVWEKLPLFLLAIVSSVITFWAQKKGGAVGSMELYPLTSRVANALVSYVKYIGKTIWPVDLAAFYPHPGSLPAWQVVGAGVLLVLITVAALRSLRQRPWFVVGWLWFVGTLVPVIGLVQIGLQAMADRYTYIPLIGLFMIVAWGVSELIGGWQHKKKLLATAAIILLMALSVVSWRQTTYWKNSVTLFQHALAVTENNYWMHNNLGFALTAQGRLDEAIAQYENALKINPVYEPAHLNLGIALISQGKVDQCIAYYQDVLRHRPDFAEVHHNLGVILFRTGQTEEALIHLGEAIRLRPEYAEAYNSLGAAMVFQGKVEDAILCFNKALQLKPDYVEPKNNLAKLSTFRKSDDRPPVTQQGQ
jgi:tetratricopeptide (TPR) repeat protein